MEEYNKNYNEGFKRAGVFWAFSNKQFEENKTHKDAPDNEYLNLGDGGFIHKSNKPKLDYFFKVELPKLKKDFLSKIKMEDLIEYELANHESYYIGDISLVAFIIHDYYGMPVDEAYKKVKDVYDATKHNYMGI